MANQRIKLGGPPEQGTDITIDVINDDTDVVEQADVPCTELTNALGQYLSDIFVDTLVGRYYIVKKLSGSPFGADFVTLDNASATYKAEGLTAASELDAAGFLTAGDIDGFTVEQVLKLIAASVAGKMNRAGTTVTFRALDDSKARITATTDSTGRTLVTLDAAG